MSASDDPNGHGESDRTGLDGIRDPNIDRENGDTAHSTGVPLPRRWRTRQQRREERSMQRMTI